MSHHAPIAWASCVAVFAAFVIVGTASAPGETTSENAGAAGAVVHQNPELVARVGEGDSAAGPSRALAIETLDVDLDVVGDTVRTTITAHFINSGDTTLEGNFVFDMPVNSVVTGYALDVNGKMVDGVLVGARRATKTFEAAERRGVDPGIAEVTRTGAFMTRVFPILPRSGRTVRLTFVTPCDRGWPFELPLVTQRPVSVVSIHAKADRSTWPLRGPKGLALNWSRTKDGLEAHAEAKNIVLSGAVGMERVIADPVQVARNRNGETFFEIYDHAPSPSDAAVKPDYVRLYWDTSRSHRDANLDREIRVVQLYIDTVKPKTLDLVLFADGRPQVRTLRSPSVDDVTAVLRNVDYQGGTSFHALLDLAMPVADTCLVFSDGSVTVDSYRIARMPCRVSTISGAADANRALLTAFAEKSGGVYIDVSAEWEDSALRTLLNPGPRVLDVRTADGRAIDYALLRGHGSDFRLIGPLPENTDAVVVTLMGAAENTRRYPVARNGAVFSDALSALWAARHLDDMRAEEKPDQDALVDFSRRYSVASPLASFAVFETPADYVSLGVEPPVSAGEAMIAEYRRTKSQTDDAKVQAQRDRVNQIVAMWDDQKKWWQTHFKPVERRPIAPPKRPLATPGQAGAPPPPPAPPPAAPPADINIEMSTPAPAPAQERDGTAEVTVVTASRLPQANLTTVSPDTSVSSEDIANTGVTRVEDIVSQLPQAYATQNRNRSIAVKVSAWNPDRPYLKALNAAVAADYRKVYRAQEAVYGTLPAFYLDVAEFLFRHGQRVQALTVLLNALELPSANTTTMTIVADRLMRYGDDERAIWLYERILYLEQDRPQPRRNLALALIARAERKGDRAEPAEARRRDYARAVDLLNDVVTHNWQTSYDGIEIISLMEANRVVPKLRRLGQQSVPLDARLIAALDVDLRVTLEWNTDETDMDLWVDEPSGERAIYSNPKTQIGGRLSNDMTNGYGPEEYLLHRAPDGQYVVRANVYRTDTLNPNGATTVRVHVFRNYGRASEQEQTLELELKRDTEDTPVIGTVTVGGRAH